MPPDYDPAAGWPRDPQQLVAHLNRWDRDELEVVARPESHPDQAPSGETNGWVTEHVDRLHALGTEVAWNAAERCYGIAPGNPR